MVKKHEEMTADQEAALVAERDAGRVIAGQSNKAVDPETASHLWQAGSNAVNSNVMSEHPNAADSVLSKIDSEENLKAKEDAADAIADKEYDDSFDCSKLDVSDINYCQPGSERHKAFLKK